MPAVLSGFWSGFLFFLLFVFFLPASALADLVKARAAVAIDPSTEKIFYSKNPNRRLPPASTTKLMTAIIAVENEELSRVVTITRNAARTAPTRAGFREGDRVTVEDLLHAALISSANDAAVALAEAVAGSEKNFVGLMNEKAGEIGARDTRFINATGLPGPGQHITALDLSRILKYAMTYPKIREIIGTSQARITTARGKTISLRSTDKLLGVDDKVIGGKTGYTRSALHCFVCAAGDDNNMIIVALLGSPNRKNLWAGTERLIGKYFKSNRSV
jgi:serine-type D-Ala-D-Ala carboxypeptidase (penicillin-binding protein 5/6)